ncbi:uncharacterized protein LOC134062412 [Sardina pilchardus]|uniref:uncharacterized protein LOC134062412 n=1 Tax=Sardina pilchardus TaxID=27697 RepID=UPI002E0D0EB0
MSVVSTSSDITLVGNMEQPNPSGFPCSLASKTPEVGQHGVRDILRLHTSPIELGDTQEKSLSSKQRDSIQHLLSDSVMNPLVKPLVDQIVMDYKINTRSPGSEAQVNLELSCDLAEKIMKDIFLQLFEILIPLSGPAANTRDSAVEDSTTSTARNGIPVDRDDLPSGNCFSGVPPRGGKERPLHQVIGGYGSAEDPPAPPPGGDSEALLCLPIPTPCSPLVETETA